MASASSAPPSGRMTEWTVSHALSTNWTLSAKNSASVPIAAAPITHGLARMASAWSFSGSAIQPKCIAIPVTSVTR